VDVDHQVLPRAREPFHLRLSAELPLGADLLIRLSSTHLPVSFGCGIFSQVPRSTWGTVGTAFPSQSMKTAKRFRASPAVNQGAAALAALALLAGCTPNLAPPGKVPPHVSHSRSHETAHRVPAAGPPVNGRPVRLQHRPKPATHTGPARDPRPASAGLTR